MDCFVLDLPMTDLFLRVISKPLLGWREISANSDGFLLVPRRNDTFFVAVITTLCPIFLGWGLAMTATKYGKREIYGGRAAINLPYLQQNSSL